MKRVLWLHSDHQGCGAYRAYIPAMSLESPELENVFLLQQTAALSDPAKELEGIDLVVFQRAFEDHFKLWVNECLRRDIPTIAELDDDLFHIPRHNPAHDFYMNRRHITKWFLQQASHVIVSTEPLRASIQDELRWWTPERITVCPNHLHPGVWGPEMWSDMEQYPNGDRVVIGWQGSMTHDTDFREVLPALGQILSEFPHVICRFFGSVPMSIVGVIPPERFQWSKGVPFDRYPRFLYYQHFDIGLAPITDSKLNRAKSMIKWMEYGVFGIPCVASNVYPYAKAVTHGQTGFLATSTREWYIALRQLVVDETARRRVGRAAQRQVWEKHGPLCADTWRTAFAKAGLHLAQEQLAG